uniref:Restriction of telomere capping protein 4 C-terminal domain-containing protein n=1 Tax=Mycena chlorophos TaxID=658473 RepID=A0ABQ0KW34_MYCCL|nr:predicted protein [Mycena chlorophos]
MPSRTSKTPHELEIERLVKENREYKRREEAREAQDQERKAKYDAFRTAQRSAKGLIKPPKTQPGRQGVKLIEVFRMENEQKKFNKIVTTTKQLFGTKLPTSLTISQHDKAELRAVCLHIRDKIPFFKRFTGIWAIKAIIRQNGHNTSYNLRRNLRELGYSTGDDDDDDELDEGDVLDSDDEDLGLEDDEEEVEDDEDEPKAPKAVVSRKTAPAKKTSSANNVKNAKKVSSTKNAKKLVAADAAAKKDAIAKRVPTKSRPPATPPSRSPSLSPPPAPAPAPKPKAKRAVPAPKVQLAQDELGKQKPAAASPPAPPPPRSKAKLLEDKKAAIPAPGSSIPPRMEASKPALTTFLRNTQWLSRLMPWKRFLKAIDFKVAEFALSYDDSAPFSFSKGLESAACYGYYGPRGAALAAQMLPNILKDDWNDNTVLDLVCSTYSDQWDAQPKTFPLAAFMRFALAPFVLITLIKQDSNGTFDTAYRTLLDSTPYGNTVNPAPKSVIAKEKMKNKRVFEEITNDIPSVSLTMSLPSVAAQSSSQPEPNTKRKKKAM